MANAESAVQQDPEIINEQPLVLTAEERLTLQNVALREQNLQLQVQSSYEALGREQQAVVAQIKERLGIDMADYKADAQGVLTKLTDAEKAQLQQRNRTSQRLN